MQFIVRASGDFKDSLVSSLSPSSPLLSLVIVLRVRVWGGKHPARRGYSYATETSIRGTIPFFLRGNTIPFLMRLFHLTPQVGEFLSPNHNS
jgi:hypothetical protein